MAKTFIFLLTILIIFINGDISLEQYQQLEKDSPQTIFETRSKLDLLQHTPHMQKLIFITPWNKQGHQLSIKYAKKLDYISPCWFQLLWKDGHISLNQQSVDKEFIERIKAANPQIKILPRVYLSGAQHALLSQIGSTQGQLKNTVNKIMSIVNQQNVDGIVWDSPFDLLIKGQRNAGVNSLIVQIVNSIRQSLPNNKLLFYNMANPLGQSISNQAYSKLHVNAILIQNYDNNQYASMLKNSINWAKSCNFKKYNPKIFLLLPFYSKRNNQGVSTKEVYQALQKNGLGRAQIQSINGGICLFVQSTTRITSYVPCYAYFKQSFKKIQEAGYNVGFWQGGNGLQNYYTFL